MECNLQRISLIAIWFLPVPCTNFINKKKTNKKNVCGRSRIYYVDSEVTRFILLGKV